ncbi:toll/interleukin-1 receptor domain-containing protein [Salinimicrobium sp. CAU 1759]
MKVFLSWSGNQSHEVAKLLDSWIRCVLQAVDPWLSSRDIDRGSLWFSEINNQLADTNNGIVCLTRENLNSPWILFESGALAKGLSSNRIFTFLIDVEPKEVRDPLAQFNHTFPTKESLYSLIMSINKGLEERSLDNDILRNVFDTFWPKFEADFKKIIKNTPKKKEVEKRSEEDILSEVLYSVRGIDKRLRQLEDKEAKSSSFPLFKANKYTSGLDREKIVIDRDDIQLFNSDLTDITNRRIESDRNGTKKNNRESQGGFFTFTGQ